MLGKHWVINLILFFCLTIMPIQAYAVCAWERGNEEEVVICDGLKYRVFDEQETADLLSKIELYRKSEEKIILLENQIKIQDNLIKNYEDQIDLYKLSMETDRELIDKLFRSPYAKPDFLKRPVVNFAAGALTLTAAFFLWEFARNGDNPLN